MAASVLGASRLCFAKSAPEIKHGLQKLVSTYEVPPAPCRNLGDRLWFTQSNLDRLVAQCGALNKAAPGTELFAATFGALASADGHAALASAELTLPALVSADPAARAASSEAKKQLQQMWNRAYGVPV